MSASTSQPKSLLEQTGGRIFLDRRIAEQTQTLGDSGA
jgi:hypothetical protein